MDGGQLPPRPQAAPQAQTHRESEHRPPRPVYIKTHNDSIKKSIALAVKQANVDEIREVRDTALEEELHETSDRV